MAEPSRVPDTLTIEEAARILRIGRTAAYALTRMWRDTGGQAGIPNFEIGGQYRVATGALEETIGRPITHVPEPAKRARKGIVPSSQTSMGTPEPTNDGKVRPMRHRQAQPEPSSGAGQQGALPL